MSVNRMLRHQPIVKLRKYKNPALLSLVTSTDAKAGDKLNFKVLKMAELFSNDADFVIADIVMQKSPKPLKPDTAKGKYSD